MATTELDADPSKPDVWRVSFDGGRNFVYGLAANADDAIAGACQWGGEPRHRVTHVEHLGYCAFGRPKVQPGG